MPGFLTRNKQWPALVRRHPDRSLVFALSLFGIVVSVSFGNRLFSLVDARPLVPVDATELWYAASLIVMLYGVGLFFVFVIFKELRDRVIWFTVFFVVRAMLGFLLATAFQYDDERGFHYAGIGQLSGMLTGEGGKGYYQLVETLYWLLYPSILLPKIVNALIGAVLPFLIYDLALAVHRDCSAARRAFLFAGLLPPLVIFSAVNLKEVLTAFLFVGELWFLVRWQKGFLWRFGGALFGVALLWWLRGMVWASVGLGGLLVWLALWKEGVGRRVAFVPTFGRLVLAGAIGWLAWGLFGEGLAEMIQSRLVHETHYIERFSGSEAQVMAFVDTSEPLAPSNLGILFLRGLFSPSPLRWAFDSGIDTILEMVVMLTWYALCPFAVIGWLRASDRRLAHACATLAIVVLVLATTAVMFGADPLRHRIAMMGPLYVLSSGGLSFSHIPRLRWVIRVWWIGAVVFTGMWLVA